MTSADEFRPALVAAGIGKRFGATPALIDAGLTVRQGTIHALLGGNGSGKSTLIKCLAGVYTAHSGSVAIGTEHLAAASLTPVVSRRTGMRFVHQDLGLFPQMSIAENIALAGGYPTGPGGRVRWQALRTRVVELLERFDIDARPDDLVGGLRPSRRSLVAIARALDDAPEQSVLLLDEPTATLSDHEAKELMTALRARADAGQTIILVSHRFPEVSDVADDVTVFRDGRVAATDRMAAMPIDRLVSTMTGGAASAPPPKAASAAAGVPRLAIEDLTAGGARGVTLDVHPGEVVGLAGLGGSGRSSLLRAVFGALPTAGGSIRIDGEPYRPVSPGIAMRAGVAFVPEDRHADAAFLDLAVRENMTVAVLRRYWKKIRIDHAAERRGSEDLISRFRVRASSGEASLGSLSGGNQQKVMIARWLQRDPELLLLDEPTQGVDVVARAEISRALAGAAAGGCSILVASSDLEELLTITHRIIVLRAGRVVADLPTEQTTRDEIAHLMMADAIAAEGAR